MVALYQISTNTVIQNYGNTIPETIYLPSGDAIHCPGVDWISNDGDYKFIPVIDNNIPPNSWSIIDAASEAVVNNELVITVTYRDPLLVDTQTKLCDLLADKAEEVRLKFIAPGAGQMGIYLLMYQEAIQVIANTNALPADYPLNGVSVGLPGLVTIQDSAKETISKAQMLIAAGSIIEKTKLFGMAAVNAANTVSDALAAFNNVSWTALGG